VVIDAKGEEVIHKDNVIGGANEMTLQTNKMTL
jgi:hypothetical protein